MSHITCIGRNVKGEPLSDTEWEDFCNDLVACYDQVDAIIRGSSWSTEWGAEETFVVIGYTDQSPESIVNLGWVWNQEAVTLGVVAPFDSTRTFAEGELSPDLYDQEDE